MASPNTNQHSAQANLRPCVGIVVLLPYFIGRFRESKSVFELNGLIGFKEVNGARRDESAHRFWDAFGDIKAAQLQGAWDCGSDEPNRCAENL
ncbi:MAG: hypothetical protein BKPUNTRY_001450 [Candidatus Fervidibacter sp.]